MNALLFQFARERLASYSPEEQARARELAKEVLKDLDKKGEIDLAHCLLESYQGREGELLLHFPEISEAMADWWEATEASAKDDYAWENRRDHPATGTSLKAL